jgi:broad specificity phosphatase PhoE
MEIILIRHGEPEYELKGKARAKDISKVIENYDLSGIKDKPPRSAIERVSSIGAVVCSDLKRSIESAKALGFENINHSEPLYREVALPHFKSGEISMSLDSWGILLRVISIFGFSRNGESLAMAKGRAKQATLNLVNIAKDEKSVLLVGHGFINYFIAKELLNQKWAGPAKPGDGYWDYGTYRYCAK